MIALIKKQEKKTYIHYVLDITLKQLLGLRRISCFIKWFFRGRLNQAIQ